MSTSLDVEKDFRDYLAGLPGAPFGAADTNIACGYRRSPVQPGVTDSVSLWIDVTEGHKRAYQGRIGGSPSGMNVGSLYCKVLSPPSDLETGMATARLLRDTLQNQPPPGYGDCQSDMLALIPGGRNEAMQELIAVNFSIWWEN